jgi:hypothetical protein
LKYLFVFLLAIILIGTLSCRLAYRMGQESNSEPDASNTQQQAPGSQSGSPAPSNPQSAGMPVIDRFAAYALTPFPGWALSWSVSNATSVTLSPGIGAVALSENRTVSPSTTTTYILTATNSTGSRSKAITLTVTH